MEWTVLFVVWGICGIVAATICDSRGGNWAAGFAVGFLLGPLGILLSLFMGSEAHAIEAKVAAGRAKKCPMCAEAVLPEAVICKHCGHDFYAEFKDVQ